MSEHSPLPWEAVDTDRLVHGSRIFAKNHYIGTMGNSDDARDQARANAEFIVVACNSHYALTERIKALEEALRGMADDVLIEAEPDCPCAACEKAKAARALLEKP